MHPSHGQHAALHAGPPPASMFMPTASHESHTPMMALHQAPPMHPDDTPTRPPHLHPDGLLNLRALHGDDTINGEVTFPTGRDAKYFLQDYCFNQNKAMKLRVGKNSGNSKTFVCTSEPHCEWRVVATKSKRKNEDACFYFSTIHNIHSPGCVSTRKPSERQHMLLTSSSLPYNVLGDPLHAPTEHTHPVAKKPRRINPVDKVVKTLVDSNVDRHKLSIKAIQHLFQSVHGHSISAHTATRAKQTFFGLTQHPVPPAPSSQPPQHYKARHPSGGATPDLRPAFQLRDLHELVEESKMVEAAFGRAAAVGDLSAVQTLLRNVDVVASSGHHALLAATKGQHLSVVDCLLSHGANTEAIDEHGATALMVAVHMGHFHIAKCLLDHGARVDTTDDTSKTPLMVAARNGHLKLVKLLCKRQAAVDMADEDDNTALLLATQRGHTDVVNFLLKKGANRHVQNLDGQDAVSVAAALHSYEMGQLFAVPSNI
ncbi:hypothetical protein H310_10825 [Aphanomyces invadans]|uniref:Uncharacterized protein n=1 Tax=Aphanomyces invadans TaxID=157072 RepID=A0A024TP24_9STRA|nr:hypothetical protein H310_10825 [Aphanomyces invadans]ETV95759.1 hypothetical protein H310_10825 [Aphanomyces invadans]|eukprot:XP_008875510.1 hypothetical protein H310_10825 [Aphanomyces invadans]